ncbi:MAG: T9SS type A sorting domain-containing protein [Bacteroidales bacterium]|nr:T9SS type A sorting domain-containing protein [Bacteroidales bacterium]
MKSLTLTFCLFAAIAFYGYSQNLMLSDNNGPIAANSTIIQAGTPESTELITYLNVKNTGSNTLNILCKKVELKIIDSTEVAICWAGGCYSSTTFVSPNAQAIAAGETITDFSGHYSQIAFRPIKSGESVVRWVFYDQSNVNDSVSLTVKYTTYPLGIDQKKASQGALSNIYPNPASAVARISCSVPPGSNGTIIIRDMLGTSILAQALPANSGYVTINTTNLSDGIYFCTLLVDGSTSQTKKLIVKH